MTFVLVAKWTAREGEEERVAEALRRLAGPTRAEPGCLMWIPNRDPENPRVFLIYEQYVDPAALDAHAASPHFQEIAVGEAIPLLEERERTFYETMDT